MKKIIPLVSLIVLASCSDNQEKLHLDSIGSEKLSEATLSAGDEALSGGKFNDAADMYMKAYNANPDADTAIRLGHALRLAGKNEQAVVNLKQAVGRFPNNVELLTELARDAIEGGYLTQASNSLNKAINLPNPSWDTYMTYGAYYVRKADYPQAEVMFKKGESLAPDERSQYSAQANIALTYVQRGDIEKGIQMLEAIASNPGVDPRVHADLALLYGLRGNDQAFKIQASQSNMNGETIKDIKSWMSGDSYDPMFSSRTLPRKKR